MVSHEPTTNIILSGIGLWAQTQLVFYLLNYSTILDMQEFRKSYMIPGEIYFWTAAINNWIELLKENAYKTIIVDSLDYLVNKSKITVFAFVIMRNHVHFIWRMDEINGKESARASFLKFTAHAFQKKIIADADQQALSPFAVEAPNKKFEFWQRDPLAQLLYTKKVAYQKLDYIHFNPVRANLVVDPIKYMYSSAGFYMDGAKPFSFLSDIREMF